MPLALVEAAIAAGGEPAYDTAGPGTTTVVVITGSGPLALPGPRIAPGP